MGLKRILLILIVIFTIPAILFNVYSAIDILLPPSLDSLEALDETTVGLFWTEPSDTSLIIQYNIYKSSDGRSFTFLDSASVGNTKYVDSGLNPSTYTYYMASMGSKNESPPSKLLSITLGGLNSLAEPPTIIGIKSDGIDQLIVVWEEPKDTSVIISYNIERVSDKEIDFSLAGSVPVGTTFFADTKLATSTKYTYRVISIDNAGNPSKPSNEFTGVVNIDQTDLTAKGVILEPNPTNSFNKLQKEIVVQTVELFNVDPSIIDLMINDVENVKLNAYEIIKKMLDGSYGSSDELKNAGAFYGQFYIDENNISKFLSDIQEKAKIANGGSNGAGDSPENGVLPTTH